MKVPMMRQAKTAPAAADVTAPPIVHEVLRSPGQPLAPDTRDFMEFRLGHDFSQVRVHTDAPASESAQAVNALAYTVGREIAFREGQYAPRTMAGRDLLAHELAHVIQQEDAEVTSTLTIDPACSTLEAQAQSAARSASGQTPGFVPLTHTTTAVIQRRKSDEDVKRAALDLTLASFIETFNSAPAITPTAMLLSSARHLAKTFDSPAGPATQTAAARVLIATYFILLERAAQAPRSPGGALLIPDSIGNLKPWTPTEPETVEEIRLEELSPASPQNTLFSIENVQAWAEVVASAAPTKGPEPAPAKSSSSGKSKKLSQAPKAAPAEPASPALDSIESPAAKRSRVVGSELETQKQTELEETTQSIAAEGSLLSGTLESVFGSQSRTGGAADISQALTLLRTITLGNAMDAIARRLSEASAVDSVFAQAQVARGTNDNASLLDTTGEIWYVANGLYVVDRSGHIAPGKFRFSMKATSLDPGVYFLGQFNLGYPQDDLAFTERILFRIDGGIKIVHDDIFGGTTSHDTLPLVKQGGAVLDRKAGLVIVVSPGIRQEPASFNTDNVMLAIAGAQAHVEWAILSKIAGLNLIDILVDQIMEFAVDFLARIVPGVGTAMMVFEGLGLAEYFTAAAMIAGYARSSDEIDMASQAFARKIAELAVDKVVEKGAKKGGQAVKKVAIKAGEAIEILSVPRLEVKPAVAPVASDTHASQPVEVITPRTEAPSTTLKAPGVAGNASDSDAADSPRPSTDEPTVRPSLPLAITPEAVEVEAQTESAITPPEPPRRGDGGGPGDGSSGSGSGKGVDEIIGDPALIPGPPVPILRLDGRPYGGSFEKKPRLVDEFGRPISGKSTSTKPRLEGLSTKKPSRKKPQLLDEFGQPLSGSAGAEDPVLFAPSGSPVGGTADPESPVLIGADGKPLAEPTPASGTLVDPGGQQVVPGARIWLKTPLVPDSVWDGDVSARGFQIEAEVIKQRYPKAKALPPGYEAFDAVEGGVTTRVYYGGKKPRDLSYIDHIEGARAISIKSIDLYGTSFQTADNTYYGLKHYIEDIRTYPHKHGRQPGNVMVDNPVERILHLEFRAEPNAAQMAGLARLRFYAAEFGIKLVLVAPDIASLFGLPGNPAEVEIVR